VLSDINELIDHAIITAIIEKVILAVYTAVGATVAYLVMIAAGAGSQYHMGEAFLCSDILHLLGSIIGTGIANHSAGDNRIERITEADHIKYIHRVTDATAAATDEYAHSGLNRITLQQGAGCDCILSSAPPPHSFTFGAFTALFFQVRHHSGRHRRSA
jgi:hypothetical protein